MRGFAFVSSTWRRVADQPLVRSSVLLGALMTVAHALSYVYRLAMGRMLGPEDYGTLASLLALITLMDQPLAALQTNVTHQASYWGSRDSGGLRHQLANLVKSSTAVGFLVGSAFVGGAYLWLPGGRTHWELFALVAASFVVGAPQSVFLGLLNANQRFAAFGLVGVASAAARVLVGVALVLLGLGVVGALGGALARVVLLLVGAALLARWPAAGPRGSLTTGGFLNYTWPVALTMIGFAGMTNLDILAAKWFLTDEQAGLYAGAAVLGRLIVFLPAGIGFVLVPLVSERYSRRASTAGILRASMILTVAVALAATGLFVAVPEFTLRMLLGPAFVGAAPLLAPIGVAMTALAVVSLFIRYFLSIRRPRIALVPASFLLLEAGLLALLHDSTLEIIAAVTISAVAAVAVSSLLAWRIHVEDRPPLG